MAAVLAVPYTSRRLKPLRVIAAPWEHPPEAESTAPAMTVETAAPTATGEQVLPPTENTPTVNNALPAESTASLPSLREDIRDSLRTMDIEDPSGHALDPFFEKLARTQRKEAGAVTRILHYGDSTIASDYISGTMRRRLQARFGDAGHGFILIANPWEWYFHNDVNHSSSGHWLASRLAGPIAADGMYGLGGVSFSGYAGDIAWFGTATHGDYGRSVSRFDLYYLEQPGGGNVELRVDDAHVQRFSTRGEAKVTRVRSLHVDDGPAKMSVRVLGGPVRLFGVALEREVPGVVYDALGSHAAMAFHWQRQNRQHWKEELALRDPSLVIIQYGTNESDMRRLDRQQYEKVLGDLVDELREASGAPVLIVSPLDRAEWGREGRLVTKPVIFDLITIQRRVAAAHGAAFFSTFDAMGGEGSMARWVRARPQLAGGDLTHPTVLGAEVIGDLLSAALVNAFRAYETSSR
jgi:lysophospholipase L1-like esterase